MSFWKDDYTDIELVRRVKSIYILDAMCKLFNYLIILLFFYMAQTLSGNLSTHWRGVLERMYRLKN